MKPTEQEKETFLKMDLLNSLKYLFEGAVAWVAADSTAGCRHLKVLAMYTGIVEARALYAFYYDKHPKNDDAVATDILKSWVPPWSSLYCDYMASKKPVQKRIFHLVYNREIHSGGTRPDEKDHLKNQVLVFAKDLLKTTQNFASEVDPVYGTIVKKALKDALNESQEAAEFYGIKNPLIAQSP